MVVFVIIDADCLLKLVAKARMKGMPRIMSAPRSVFVSSRMKSGMHTCEKIGQ